TKDQNWNDAANWPDGLPSLTSDVTIPTGKSPIISATDQITIFSLDVANGASLTIESGATGTGSLIVNGTVSGEVTVERHIGGNSLDWHLVSSPVDGQAISGTDNWQPNDTYDFYAWYEKEETWVNRKNTTGSPVGEGPRFDDAIVNGNLNFNPPKGYMIAYQTVGVEKSFTGTLVNENKSYTLQKESTGTYTGLNLVGNPFSSTIAGNDAASGQDEFDFLTTNSSVLADDYIAYYYWDNSKNPKDYTAINNASSAHYIEVGQGFFVIAKSDEATLNINKNLRKHGDATFYKSNSSRNALVIEINDQNGKKTSTELVILQNASLGLDPGYDAAKLYGNNELNVYSFINTGNDQTFTIQSIPRPQEETRIPIGLQTNQADVFHFTFEPTELFTQEGKVYLFDKVTQMKTEITAEAEYLFELEEAGEYNDRFEIHFGVVGIGEQDQATTLHAYAYNNRLYVNNSLEQAQIAVYDLQGRLLMQQSANTSGLQSLPLDLPAGVYVVRLSNAQEAKSLKINVQ
ncbi:MAG: T9SS type A sorting domain-containing protein, partial [Bacteroidales bacterium]|nr:T9SS type A sorting domain-containing protein [Bacteroidales bacterium]